MTKVRKTKGISKWQYALLEDDGVKTCRTLKSGQRHYDVQTHIFLHTGAYLPDNFGFTNIYWK